MKRLLRKYKKQINAGIFKKIVDFIQKPEVEESVANVIVNMLPKQKGFGAKEQKAIAVAVIDKMTDKIAVSLGLQAD